MKRLMIAALLAGSLSVFAHEGMHGPGGRFDADGSGTLSLNEFTAYLKSMGEDVTQAAARFSALDANGDGKLSAGEMSRAQVKKPAT